MRKTSWSLLVILLAFTFSPAVFAQEEPLPATQGNTVVPNLIRFAGTVAERSRTSTVVGVTFSIYAEPEGGAALWTEVQNVRVGRDGRYSALLGATTGEGVPMELFSDSEPRWLGVQVEGQRETRTLLVSVPYALKAAFSVNAQTLAGQPASSYVTKEDLQSGSVVMAGVVEPLATINGTTGRIAKFTSTSATDANLGNSLLTESGSTIGVITTAPEFTFHIKDTGTSPELRLEGALNSDAVIPILTFNEDVASSGFCGFQMKYLGSADQFQMVSGCSTPVVRMSVNRVDGNVGIGTDVPERTLHVKGGSGAMIFDAGAIASNPVLFFTHDNFASKFRNRIMADRTNESMQIWSQNGARLTVLGDKVGINTTDPQDALQVIGDIRAGTAGINGCLKSFDGTAIAGACSSDARLKMNIHSFAPMLSRVTALRPVTYEWRADEHPEYAFGTGQVNGLIAQEVEQIFPELVAADARGFKTVNYSQLPLLLLQAVKELKAENDALKQTLANQDASLAEQVRQLQEKVEQLSKTK